MYKGKEESEKEGGGIKEKEAKTPHRHTTWGMRDGVNR